MASGRRGGVLDRVEGAIGWAALGATLLAALPRGAAIPVAWLGLALVVFALFAVQLVVDLVDRAAPARLGRLVVPGILAVGALAWGLAQTSAAFASVLDGAVAAAAGLLGTAPPATLVHPAWGAVDTPGAISADPIDGRQGAIRIALYLALFWIAVRTGGDGARAARMVRVIAVAVAALATFGLFAAASGENVILGETPGGVSASFVNRNSFATYAAFGVLVSLSVLLASDAFAGAGASRRQALRGFLERFFAGSWLFLAAFVVSATALVASQSRGGALAAVAGLAMVLVAHRRNAESGRRAGLLLALAGIAFVFAIGAAGLLGRFAAAGEEMRFPVYAAAIGGLADRPYVGHGLGGFQDAFRAYVPRAAGMGGEWDLAHNTYLELAFELGLPAAAAFFLALLLVVAPVVRGALVRRAERVAVPLAGAGCAVAAAVHSAFDFSLQIPAIGALFAVILGLAWAQSAPRETR